MKESKLYLQFFRQNLVYFLIGWVLFTTIGILYQIQKPATYKSMQTLELPHSISSGTETVAEIQEAVTLARSINVQRQLGIQSTVTVYNNSRFTVVLDVASNSPMNLETDSAKLTQYLMDKFQLSLVGMTVNEMISPSYVLGAVAGFAVGTLVTLLVVLLRAYLKNY